MSAHNFREMIIWKDSIQIAKSAYAICSEFPAHEKFGIVSQIQRAAVSVGANIAEGSGRSGNADFKRFLAMSISSAYEPETLLTLAKEIGYIGERNYLGITEELQGLQKKAFKFNQQLQ